MSNFISINHRLSLYAPDDNIITTLLIKNMNYEHKNNFQDIGV
jgi:hypothetical protein